MAVAAPPALAPVPAVGAGRAAQRRPLIYYGYYLVGVALVAQFISAGTQTYVAGVFLKPMTEDLDWTRSQFNWGQSVSRFVMAFAGFFVGAHVDKGRARGMMVIGCTILGSGLMLTSIIRDIGPFTAYHQWLLLRGVFFTIGAAMLSNLVVNVTLSKWWVEKRGRVVGISSMGVSLAGVLLPIPITWVVDGWGWRVGWQVLAILAWALIYPAAMLMRSTPEKYGLNPDGRTDEEMASARGASVRADFANSLTRAQALHTPALYLIVLAFGFSGVGLGTMLQQSIPFMTDAGISRLVAAQMFWFLTMPAAFSKPLWGVFLDRVPAKVLAAISFMIAAAGMPVVVLGGELGSIPVLAAGFFLVGLGLGGQIPISETIWASYFGRRYLGQVRGVALPFSLILGAGGPQLVSMYFDRVGNYDGAFFGLAAMWTVAAGFVLLVRRPQPPSQSSEAAPGPATGPTLGSGGAPPSPHAPTGPAPSPAAVRPAPEAARLWVATPTTAPPTRGSLGFTRPSNGVQPSDVAGNVERVRAPARRSRGLPPKRRSADYMDRD